MKPDKCAIVYNLFLCSLLGQCYAAKILGIFPNYGYSQFILGGKLMRELVTRGHEVTVISPFPTKTPIENYTDVSVEGMLPECTGRDLFDMAPMTAFHNIIEVNDLGLYITEYIFEDTKVKALLNSNTTFDLVICELFFNYAQMAFAQHFKAPLILLSSQGPNEWSMSLLRHPLPSAYVPSANSEYSSQMHVFQRIVNLACYSFFDIYYNFIIEPRHNKYLEKYLPNSPKIADIVPTINLVLYNSHVSSNVIVPTLPNMIEVGGFHVDPKPLPANLQKFLDEATDGAIYFSMGSNLNGNNMPIEKRRAFLSVFSKLRHRVLWKFEDDNIEGITENVKIGKWMPQQDILAHPNVKLFITHSGLLSTIEAVYFGVPMLAIPIFGDQKMNAAVSKQRGIGLILKYENITEESLTENINELLKNPRYIKNAKFRSTIMKDQEMKPLDKAIFWIEYVLRHKNTKHLQIHGIQMPWYQFYMVDVFLIMISCTVIFIFICRISLVKYRNLVTNDKEKIKKS